MCYRAIYGVALPAGKSVSAQVLESAFGFLARQASEQYFTSAQFLAQLLRQVISRPQVTQILLGKLALLPLKPDLAGIDGALSVQRVAVMV